MSRGDGVRPSPEVRRGTIYAKFYGLELIVEYQWLKHTHETGESGVNLGLLDDPAFTPLWLSFRKRPGSHDVMFYAPVLTSRPQHEASLIQTFQKQLVPLVAATFCV